MTCSRFGNCGTLGLIWSSRFAPWSLLPQVRSDAVGAIVATVAPGGVVWVRCLAKDAAEPVGVRPGPVTPEELGWFEHAGLRTVEFREEPPSTGRGRSVTAVYQRAWS